MARLKVLLTGGSGMVGRNVREHPAASGWDLHAPTHAELDLLDAAKTASFVRELGPDVVVHAAGLVGGIQANMAQPVNFLVANIQMGQHIVLAAHAAGVPRLLNLGSSCMYPRAAPNPLVEELVLAGELEPTNEGYALAKIVTARLCDYIRREDPSRRYQTVIPCNLYGRHDSFDPRNSHLVPAIIHKIHLARQGGAQTVEIWGDGTARREFMYAGDVADAIVRHVSADKPAPDLMNLGPGIDHSINEYYEAVARVVGWKGRFVHALDKPVGMRQKLVSTRRQSEWGWQPQTSLEEGLTLTYQHYLETCAK